MIIKRKLYSLAMTRGLARVNRVLGKSPMQAKRAAIRQQDKILTPVAKAAGGIKKTKAAMNSIALNPGAATNQGIEAMARHPISVGTQIAGKATMVVDPTGMGLIPLGAIGTGGEVALRKYAPRYARVTDRLGDKFHNSTKTRRAIEGGVNTIVGTARNMFS